jgi:hypothetical protein
LSEALQRNAKHEAKLSNIPGYEFWWDYQNKSEIESLAPPRKLSGLRCGFASLGMTTFVNEKTRIEVSIRVSNITPPMPFRRITRSLSVTGG